MSAIVDSTSIGRRGARRPGDRIFQGLATGAGVLILVVLAGVAGFLLIEAWPAITADGADIPGGEGLVKYIWPLAFGTLVASTIAIIFAVPMAVCVALFISHFAPRRIANLLSYVVDLLAAIPSIIYGLWGIAVLGPASVGTSSRSRARCSPRRRGVCRRARSPSAPRAGR
jgi:phosphate transport system permease protein